METGGGTEACLKGWLGSDLVHEGVRKKLTPPADVRSNEASEHGCGYGHHYHARGKLQPRGPCNGDCGADSAERCHASRGSSLPTTPQSLKGTWTHPFEAH